MHAHGFLPPDPKTSSVPVLPPNNKDKDAGHYRGTGIFPAENHILLFEDEPSHCQRNGLIWKILEVEVKNDEGRIVAKRVTKTGTGDKTEPQTMTFDSATRIWQGRESIRVSDLISQKVWPESGKKEMKDQSVLLGITWKPAPGDGLSGAFTSFHISDIWLDDQSIEHAAYFQTQKHNSFIRTRWMPAYVDEVKYGKFGQATATLTLFGGMDQALYDDFKKESGGQINGAENTLKHTASHYGPGHMASNGKIVQVTKQEGKVPLGSSGIQVDFKTDQIIEAIRPGRVVKIRPDSWPKSQIPREEYLFNNSPENRFPTPAIFPKY